MDLNVYARIIFCKNIVSEWYPPVISLIEHFRIPTPSKKKPISFENSNYFATKSKVTSQVIFLVSGDIS